MPNIALIADDLTGAMDAGLQFGKRGLRALVPLGWQALPDAEVLVVDTDTREATASEAHRRVGLVAGALCGRTLFKKVDSTMRGNVGYELRALLEVLSPRAIVVAPAFPGGGAPRSTASCGWTGGRWADRLCPRPALADEAVAPAHPPHPAGRARGGAGAPLCRGARAPGVGRGAGGVRGAAYRRRRRLGGALERHRHGAGGPRRGGSPAGRPGWPAPGPMRCFRAGPRPGPSRRRGAGRSWWPPAAATRSPSPSYAAPWKSALSPACSSTPPTGGTRPARWPAWPRPAWGPSAAGRMCS